MIKSRYKKISYHIILPSFTGYITIYIHIVYIAHHYIVWYRSNITSHLLEIFCQIASTRRADLILCINGLYGTAQFKLEARVRVTRVYFVAPLEYFSKSCVSVDNCTRISRAIHARVTSPNMLAYIRA